MRTDGGYAEYLPADPAYVGHPTREATIGNRPVQA